MKTLARILSVEDKPNDEEMTLEAFVSRKLANEVVVDRDAPAACGMFRALIDHPPSGRVSRGI